jgi:hypothetical protein
LQLRNGGVQAYLLLGMVGSSVIGRCRHVCPVFQLLLLLLLLLLLRHLWIQALREAVYVSLKTANRQQAEVVGPPEGAPVLGIYRHRS